MILTRNWTSNNGVIPMSPVACFFNVKSEHSLQVEEAQGPFGHVYDEEDDDNDTERSREITLSSDEEEKDNDDDEITLVTVRPKCKRLNYVALE